MSTRSPTLRTTQVTVPYVGEAPTLREFERAYLLYLARLTQGNQSRMAALMGVHQTTVARRLKALRLYRRNRRSGWTEPLGNGES